MLFQYVLLFAFTAIQSNALPLADSFRNGNEPSRHGRSQRSVSGDPQVPQQQIPIPEPTIIPVSARLTPAEHMQLHHDLRAVLATSTPSPLTVGPSTPVPRPLEGTPVQVSKVPGAVLPAAVLPVNAGPTTEPQVQAGTATPTPSLSDNDVLFIMEFVKQLADPVDFLEALKKEVLEQQKATETPTAQLSLEPATGHSSTLTIQPKPDVSQAVSGLFEQLVETEETTFQVDRVTCAAKAESKCPGCYEMCVACVANKCNKFCGEDSFTREIARACAHLPFCHECTMQCL